MDSTSENLPKFQLDIGIYFLNIIHCRTYRKNKKMKTNNIIILQNNLKQGIVSIKSTKLNKINERKVLDKN